MTNSPTATELAALKVANAALLESRDSFCDMVATVVFALGSAQLLQSPETAAELARLRLLLSARPATLTEEQVEALGTAGDRAVNDMLHEDLCMCRDWPQSCASGYVDGGWDIGTWATSLPSVIGLWESMRAPAEAAELVRLRARAAELETLASALEIPRPDNALPLLLQRIHGYADRWAICDRTGRRWTRNVGWCPEFGGSADEHLRSDARFTLAEALPLARRLAAEDPHDSLLHHDYRLGHDLPEVPHA